MIDQPTPRTDAVWLDQSANHYDMRTFACTLERELAAMTAVVERVRSERDTVERQGERDRIASISYQRGRAAMNARAELAERQVLVLIGRMRHCSVCPASQHFDWRKDCKHSHFPTHEQCVECIADWSRAEAAKGVQG